jgi:hypothetical protein
MMKNFLRGYLIFGGCYFILDALLHFSNLKLLSAENTWPTSALSYARLINFLYASFVLLVASIIFVIQKDLKKYHSLVLISAIWALFHGIILLWSTWTQDYQQIFMQVPSLLVWLPFYREYLSLNSLLLFLYSGTVYAYFWQLKPDNN